jgi:CO/xanthine dehydrogenase Mo-binding subunit
MFGQAYREAGAAARVLLCKAAAARWGIEWERCTISKGVVSDGQRSLRIGELADGGGGIHPAGCLCRCAPTTIAMTGARWDEDVPRHRSSVKGRRLL